MFDFHLWSLQKFPFYKKWHDSKAHSHVHGTIYVVVTLSLCLTVFGATQLMLEAQTATIVHAQGSVYNVELDIPDYMPDYLRNPRKFISGRDLKIIKNVASKEVPISLSDVTLYKIVNNSKTLGVKLQVKKNEERLPIVTIPKGTAKGSYSIDFTDGSQNISIPIIVDIGTDNALTTTGPVKAHSLVKQFDSSIVSISRLNCPYCFWEMVSAVDPTNENYGYVVGGGADDTVLKTTNGWTTSTLSYLNQITSPLLKRYRCDPYLAFDKDGKLNIMGLFYNSSDNSEPITGGIYVEKTAKSDPFIFSQTIVKTVPKNTTPDTWLAMDFPKISIDTNALSPYVGNKYVFSAALFDDGTMGQGQYVVSKDGTISEKRADYGAAVTSTAVGLAGEVYGVIPSGSIRNSVTLVRSLDGGKSFVQKDIAPHISNNFCVPRLSSLSQKIGPMGVGPDIAVDKQGRIYVVWADNKGCIDDPNFEYSSYAEDYDIYSSYSDNKGDTWTAPVKVNDDNSGGNQTFPSISVDKDNNVYVAFIDHRDNLEKSQFDVFLAKSTNRGNTFLSNMKVNDVSVPLLAGGARSIGDYLKMVSVGSSKIFVAHPCMNFGSGLLDSPSDACVSTIPKNLWNPQPVAPSLVVLSPIGNTVWNQGSDQNIWWSTVGIPYNNPVNIKLVNATTSTEYTVISATTNDGLESFNVPNSIPGGNYIIKVSTAFGGNNYTNTSSSNIQIKAVLPDTPPQVSVSTSTLSLTYDVNNKESQLVASYTVLVSSGSKALNLRDNSFVIQLLDKNSSGVITNATAPNEVMAVSPNYVINPGDTKTFNLKSSFNPKAMFAGTYHTSLMFATGYQDASPQPLDIKVTANTTNSVTVIGELSPYITVISTPADINTKVTITGVRFNAKDSVVIDGVSFALGKGDIVINSTSIIFTPNLLSIAAGLHNVVVSDPVTGESNIIKLTLSGTPAPTPIPTPIPTPTPTPPPTTSTNPKGYFDAASCSALQGWAYDADISAASSFVHVYKDGLYGTGTFVGQYTADFSRPDVDTVNKITGNHGFNISTPTSLADGKSHSIYVLGINLAGTGGGNVLLAGSPKTILCKSGAATSTPPTPPVPPPIPSPTPTSTPTSTPAVSVHCSSGVTSVAVNTNVVYSPWGVKGGTGVYTYSWLGTDGLSGISSWGGIGKTYTSTGVKTATLTVTSGGASATATCGVTVTSAPSAFGNTVNSLLSNVIGGAQMIWDALVI